jgi:DNA invertase Pin-like site-specific DNA recombinase
MQRRDRVLRALDLNANSSKPGNGSRRAGKGWQPRPHQSPQPVPVRALGYVSGHSARSDEPELTQQAAAIERFCAHREWELVGLERDVERPNGRRLPRPALTHAIERLGSGEASCLVVAELKRLCPSVAELGGILKAVEQTGARLISLKPAIDSGSRAGRVALGALMSVSGWERARREEMTFSARASTASPKTIEPKLKCRITQMREAGMTHQAIADALNEDGVPTIRGGAKWRPSSVQAALGYKRPRPWNRTESSSEG